MDVALAFSWSIFFFRINNFILVNIFLFPVTKVFKVLVYCN